MKQIKAIGLGTVAVVSFFLLGSECEDLATFIISHALFLLAFVWSCARLEGLIFNNSNNSKK